MPDEIKYRRILLKISGESLAGKLKSGIDPEILSETASLVKETVEAGVECAVVIGAGNFFRGSLGEGIGIDRARGDYMGMLATVMNGIAFNDALLKKGVNSIVMSPIAAGGAALPYDIFAARKFLSEGGVVIASGGTGSPFFTTDTAASLRALELQADLLLKATRVDGVYTADPEKDSTAVKYDTLTYSEAIEKKLRIMDMTAVSLCMDNSLPVAVFNLSDKKSFIKILRGEKSGTLIS
jgi:uridylate kinase